MPNPRRVTSKNHRLGRGLFSLRQYTPYRARDKTPAEPLPQTRALEQRAARPDSAIRLLRESLEGLKGRMNDTTRRPARAVCFDAGNVLYHRPHKNAHLATFLADLGLPFAPLPPPERTRLRALAYTGRLTKRAYQEAVLGFYGVQGTADLARGRAALEQDSAAVCFFPGVRATVLALKERELALAVITDTLHPTAVKMGWLARVGIAHVWDAFVSSCEVGVCKPDPRIYRLALDQLGIQPHEAAFVGHKASELQGARAVGLTAVAFNYDADVEADFYLEHFAGLLELPILPQIESAV